MTKQRQRSYRVELGRTGRSGGVGDVLELGLQRTTPTPDQWAAQQADEAYFAAHPEELDYVRPYVAGELRTATGAEDVPANGLVRVVRIAGPIRVRFRGDIPIPPEAHATIARLRKKYRYLDAPTRSNA